MAQKEITSYRFNGEKLNSRLESEFSLIPICCRLRLPGAASARSLKTTIQNQQPGKKVLRVVAMEVAL